MISLYRKKVGVILLITSDDVLNTIGHKIKQARLSKKYTQDYVSENINISKDLDRKSTRLNSSH